MLRETPFSILDLNLSRRFDHDKSAKALLRDGADTILATLTHSVSGWNVEDPGDGSITLRVAEGTVARSLMMRVHSIVWYPTSDIAEVFANGSVVPWRLASDQVWSARAYRPVEDYTPPVVEGAGMPIGLLLALTRAA